MKTHLRTGRYRRPIELLEERRLLSLAIDLHVDGIDAGSPVNDPGSIVDEHTISDPQVDTVYDLSVWAIVRGSGSDGSPSPTNDLLDLISGSLVASDLRTGGYFGAVQGSFSVPTLEPYFDSSTYEASPGVQYTDANQNIDIGSTDSGTTDPANFFHPVLDSTQSLPPFTLLGQGSPGAGNEMELATTTFTVTSVVNGPTTTLTFNLQPQIEGNVSAFWYEDGNIKDTLDGDGVSPSIGITITTLDTIAPTAAATLSPIAGLSTAYQFTVNYSDNQDLDTSTFDSNDILVTGPNGYSQLATYISSADTDPSADPQFDPQAVTYQITPPDGTWDIADNGSYIFTLEPNQVADMSGNPAAGTVLGSAELAIDGAVSISSGNTNIPENSATPANFTITRTDALNNNFADPLTVDYTVSGSAVAGTNYSALSGSVTVPAGQASAIISVQPLDDHANDSDTTLVLTIAPESQYALGSDISSTLTITNVAPPPTQLVFLNQPGNTTAGQTLSPAIEVEIENQYGTVATQDDSDITLNLSGNASLGGTITVAAVDGIATFSDLSITEAGTYTISASDDADALSDIASSSFTISPGAAAHLAIAQQPNSAVAGTVLSPIVVNIVDAYGNVVPGDTSAISLNYNGANGNAIGGTPSEPGPTATFSNLSMTAAGIYTFTPVDGTLTALSPATVTITPAAPAAITFGTQPVAGFAGQHLAPVSVQVTDQYGNPTDGSSVAISVLSGPSTAVLSGTLTEATTDGTATFSDLAVNLPGSYRLLATDGDLAAISSQSFTVTYASPTLVIVQQPTSVVAGSKFALQINAEDTAGSLSTILKSKISLKIFSGPAGGKLLGSVTANTKNAAAAFRHLSIRQAGTYTIVASDPSFASATTETLTVTAGAAHKLSFASEPTNTSAGTPFNVSVELLDKYGNTVNDGSTVDLVLGSHPKTAASLNRSSAVSDGFADFDGVTLGTEGNYTLKASDGKARATSKKFVVS